MADDAPPSEEVKEESKAEETKEESKTEPEQAAGGDDDRCARLSFPTTDAWVRGAPLRRLLVVGAGDARARARALARGDAAGTMTAAAAAAEVESCTGA